MVWRKNELDQEIREYVEKYSSLSKRELNDPDTPLPGYKKVNEVYGGIEECIEELGLDIRFHNRSYSRKEIIEEINVLSDGKTAPKMEDLGENPGDMNSSVSSHFGGYLNAVFMAGKIPTSGWYKAPKQNIDEISADYLELTRQSYWFKDPDDRWDTELEQDGDHYLNPRTKRIPSGTFEPVKNNVQIPDVRIPKTGVETQDNFMKLVEESESYREVLNKIEDMDITENQVRNLLNPDSKNSFGRWMAKGEEGEPVKVNEAGEEVYKKSQNEFPENSLAALNRF